MDDLPKAYMMPPSPALEDIADEVVSVVHGKQRAYGRTPEDVGRMMSVLFPGGVPPKAYGDALLTVRVLDKLCRLATAAGGPDLGNESPWSDIAGYALLALQSGR